MKFFLTTSLSLKPVALEHFLTASDHYSTVIMMMMKMMRLTMMATMKITLILLVTVKTIMIYKTMLLN